MRTMTRIGAIILLGGVLALLFMVEVPEPGWSFETVDTTAAGKFVDIVVKDGTPHIVYMDEGGGVVYARKPSLPVPGIDEILRMLVGEWRSTVVDDRSNRGVHVTIEFVDGVPAVAYKDGSTGNSKVLYAERRTGWTPETVDSIETGGANIGQHTVLSMFQGDPIIFYHRPSGKRFSYAVPEEAAWSRTDIEQGTGWFTGIASCDTEVFLGYRQRDGRGVSFGVFDGDWRSQPLNVTTNAQIGVAADGCRPYLAYYDFDRRQVRFVDVEDGFASSVVGPGRLSRVSLAADDRFHVLYHHYREGLVYGTSGGGEAWETEVIDTGSTEVEYNAIDVAGGQPYIAYTNRSSIVYATRYREGRQNRALFAARILVILLIVTLLYRPLQQRFSG